MSTKPPRIRLDGDERRTALLDVAASLFEAKAYDDVSVEDVARAAGVSKGLLYHYFPGKRQLYVALVERTADELTEAILTAIAEAGEDVEAPERLRAALRGWMFFVRARARTYEAVVRGGLGADADVQQIAGDMRERFALLLGEALGPAATDERGRIITMGWIGFVESATLAWTHGSNAVGPEEIIDASVAILAPALGPNQIQTNHSR